MNTELDKQLDLIIKIGGACFALASFAFVWIIKITKSQSNTTIKQLGETNQINNILVQHEKDIEYLKKENDSTLKKVNEIAEQLNFVKINIAETNLTVKEIKRDIETLLKRGIK